MVSSSSSSTRGRSNAKKLDWFNFPDLWKLYQQVWLWEEDQFSKEKLMDTLAMIIKVLSTKKKCGSKKSADIPSAPLIDLIGRVVPMEKSTPPEQDEEDPLWLPMHSSGRRPRAKARRNYDPKM